MAGDSIPLTDVIGVRENTVKVEESWSKDVPNAVGANAPAIPEVVRDANFFKSAIENTHKLRNERVNEGKYSK